MKHRAENIKIYPISFYDSLYIFIQGKRKMGSGEKEVTTYPLDIVQ